MAVIALGADHADFQLKETLKTWLAAHGHPCSTSALVPSTRSITPSTPSPSVPRSDAATRSGGFSCAARGIGEHNDANVLTLGARTTMPDLALRIPAAWLETGFQGGRHTRRVEKVTALEKDASHAATG